MLTAAVMHLGVDVPFGALFRSLNANDAASLVAALTHHHAASFQAFVGLRCRFSGVFFQRLHCIGLAAFFHCRHGRCGSGNSTLHSAGHSTGHSRTHSATTSSQRRAHGSLGRHHAATSRHTGRHSCTGQAAHLHLLLNLAALFEF